MKSSLVPFDHVPEVWPQIEGYMARAAEYTYGRFDAEDIKNAVMQYDHDLWVSFNENKEIKGVVITTFKHYPKKKCLDLVFTSGDDLEQWKDGMLRVLQHWAFDNHCDGIESSGRLGWSKIFQKDGYKPLWQTYELPIADSGLGA